VGNQEEKPFGPELKEHSLASFFFFNVSEVPEKQCYQSLLQQ